LDCVAVNSLLIFFLCYLCLASVKDHNFVVLVEYS